MFFKKNRTEMVLQAAQFAALSEAKNLLDRICIPTSYIEKENFNVTEELFRISRHYPVRLVRSGFGCVDAGRVKSDFCFTFNRGKERACIHVEISLQLTSATMHFTDNEGFERSADNSRWTSVRASVWLSNDTLTPYLSTSLSASQLAETSDVPTGTETMSNPWG